jgi:hypothetical protein
VTGLSRWSVLLEADATASTIDHLGRTVALYGRTVHVEGDRVELKDLDPDYAKIDTLGDGFVLARPRCDKAAVNGWIVDADGHVTTAWHAGDGIENVTTDPAGAIWIGYFDEASIVLPGRSGTPHEMRMPGLIRWTARGEPTWRTWWDRFGYLNCWVNVFAVNVGDSRVLTCNYRGHPLVEIDDRGIRRVQRIPVEKADGVLVDGEDVAIVHTGLNTGWRGGSTPGVYGVTRFRIGDEVGVTTPLLMPDGSTPPSWIRRRVCRGNRMWMQFEDRRIWYALEL